VQVREESVQARGELVQAWGELVQSRRELAQGRRELVRGPGELGQGGRESAPGGFCMENAPRLLRFSPHSPLRRSAHVASLAPASNRRWPASDFLTSTQNKKPRFEPRKGLS